MVSMNATQLNLGLMLSAALLVLTYFVWYQSGAQQAVFARTVGENYYMAANGDVVISQQAETIGDIFLLPLPVKSIDEVAQWSARVAVQLFSVDFFAYEKHFSEMKGFFTDSGWSSMQEAIYGSGWLGSLIDKKLTSSAVLTGTPIVLKHGVLNGFYTWVFNFPVLLTYESASQKVQERRVFTVTVRRVPSDFSKGQAGIAIESLRSDKIGG